MISPDPAYRFFFSQGKTLPGFVSLEDRLIALGREGGGRVAAGGVPAEAGGSEGPVAAGPVPPRRTQPGILRGQPEIPHTTDSLLAGVRAH